MPNGMLLPLSVKKFGFFANFLAYLCVDLSVRQHRKQRRVLGVSY